MTSESHVRDEIKRAAAHRFDFLVTHGGRIETEPGAWQEVLAYVLTELTIEVQLDWQEECVFVLVARSVDGHRPAGYLVDKGRVVRRYLVDAFERSGLADASTSASLRRTQRMSGPDAMQHQIDVFASALAARLEALEQAVGRVFPG